MRTSLLLLLARAIASDAFDLPGVVSSLKPPQLDLFASPSNKPFQKEAVLKAVSFTSNGRTSTPQKQLQVASVVRELETSSPPSPTLLTNPSEAAKLLDGIWYLQYTQPSEVGVTDAAWKPTNPSEGSSKISTKRFDAKGSISAGGIPVETANRVVQQIFDIAASRVTNEVETDWGRVVVGGVFRPSETVTNRAVVGFDTAVLTVNSVGPFKGFDVDISGLFAVRTFFRGGNAEAGWLEVTFIDEDLRIGRGNKGTLFVLTRDPEAVKP